MMGRCMWEVVAGIIPNTPMPEYSKRFGLTSEEWDGGSEKGVALFQERQKEAEEYARSITQPRFVNWVRIDWIWF